MSVIATLLTNKSRMNTPECNVCHIDLDEEDHQPRHLGCSHDVCTSCVKALIKRGQLECPMCREVVKVNTAEDLKINHGLVQVIRMFKEFKLSVNKTNKEEIKVNNQEICRIHKHNLDLGCVPCKLWICAKCKVTHTRDLGCEVLDCNEYLKKLKEEFRQKAEPTLLSLKNNIKSYSSEISQVEAEKKKSEQKFNSEKKKLEEKLESLISQNESEKKKVEENVKRMLDVVDEGSKTLREIEAANTDIDNASSSMEFNQRVNISNDLQQFACLWCKKNPGSFPDYKQAAANLLSIRDLVYLDLAICGTIKGRVTIRLRQDLPNYAKYIPLMFTGEDGHSLIDQKCYNSGHEDTLTMDVSSITQAMNKVTRDANAGSKIVQGSVLAFWQNDGDLSSFYFYHGHGNSKFFDSFKWEVFGMVESGLNIVKMCRSHSDQSHVTVKDCGVVI